MLAAVIAGPKKSGKTTLLSLVAEILERQGKRVAVVKYGSHPLEKGNTDAFWLMRPNRPVVSVSPEETAVFWPEQLSFEAIARHMDADVLLLEGGDPPASVPRVLCAPEEQEDMDAFLEESGPITVIAVVGNAVPSLSAPHFPEMGPAAAEKVTELILKHGAAV